jgi:drug/metabolite transporter (DMT)-like permease
MTAPKLMGLCLGAAGVMLVAGVDPPGTDAKLAVSVFACLIGASCYGLAAVYIRKFAPGVKPAPLAGCTQLMAALMLSPALLDLPSASVLTPTVAFSMLTLALVCSGAAYLLYFRLIADAGPSKALTVTFLMPAFGMLWGSLFLREAVTPAMIAGCALIALGTACVLGFVRLRRDCAA